MQVFSVREAKTRLPSLLEQMESREDVVIAQAGTPVARLVPYQAPRRRIAPPGAMEGEGRIAEDFDAPMDELFEGRSCC
jgi:prevent-host-death family protein